MKRRLAPHYGSLGTRVRANGSLWIVLVVFISATATAGCTFDKRRDGPSSSANADDDTGGGNIGDIADASDDAGAAADTAGTDSQNVDTYSPNTGLCPGAIGCPCVDESECGSGTVCTDAGDGKRCAAACGPDSPCPDEQICVTPEPGKSPVCVPKNGRVCDPCTTSQQCLHAATPDARCVDHDGLGFFCRKPCSAGDPCGPGQACRQQPIIEGGTGTFCVDVAASGSGPGKLVDCTCSKFAIEGKLATTCRVDAVDSGGAIIASCKGKRFCSDSGLSSCDAKAPADEVCNGIDDDCNSKVDDGDTAKCDDKDACTLDACSGKAGCSNKTIPDGTACDDGDACTFGDVCGVGSCVGVDKTCDDGIACTIDTCSSTTGQCLATPAQSGDCSDGNPCTVKDFCLGGQCKSGAFKDCADDDVCTSDGCDGDGKCFNNPDLGCSPICKTDKDCGDAGSPCLSNVCDQSTGKCSTKKLSGKACDDGDKCTLGDACDKGQCAPGKSLPGGCDDANVCTADLCDAKSGNCTHKANPAGAPCSTGNACGQATCDASGKCIGDSGKVCNDDDPCTKDSCDPKTGKCVFDSLGGGAACDDDDPCTKDDVCLVTSGGTKCNGKETACDDDNPCTEDVCSKLGGKAACAHKPGGDADPCDDANACTSGDNCTGGACKGSTKSCDDGKPCTEDACDAKSGECSNVDLSGGCDDGNPCTAGEVCAAGVCGGGKALNCDDDKPCTADSCDPKSTGSGSACVHAPIKGCGNTCGTNEPCPPAGGCLVAACVSGKCTTKPRPDGTACGDGDKCSGSAPACSKGQCVPGQKLNCDDDNVCTTDSCDPKAGCVNKPAAGAVKCDDGDNCTNNDACKSGSCTGASMDCDDDNACSADTCDKKSGCVHAAKAGSCDDGNDCTVGDTCAAKICKPGAKKACKDSNVCTDDGCDAKTGKCAFPTNTAPCDDTNVCTTSDRCKDGSCIGGAVNACNDNNPCTQDVCDVLKGCVHNPTTAACNDNNPCTTNDKCALGKCAGQALKCDDANPCTADKCDPAKGCVAAPTTGNCDDGDACTESDACAKGSCKGKPRVCDDKNACTDDACIAASGNKPGGCTSVPNTKPCDDGNACTVGDGCAAGYCKAGSAKVCNDSNPCTTDSCDAKAGCKTANNTAQCDDGNKCTDKDACAAGKCSGAPITCDDNNVCTTDSCDAKAGCQAILNTAACDDGDPCSLNDKCAGGKCAAGIPKPCDDGNPCTTDSCAKGKGCTPSPSTGACDDGNKCTPIDTCNGGKCVGSGAPKCDDGNPCTTDSCDAKAGCQAANNTAACDDGNACTKTDKCAGGKCAGASINCQDGNPCTDNGCKVTTGCTTNNNARSCNDGNACTKTDKCSGGKCVGSGNPNCDDNNPCTTDVCKNASGCAHTNNTASCDDGDKCTTTDACNGGKCVGSGAPKCDDGQLCTTDSCDAAKGCVNANNTINCNDGNPCTATDRCSGGKCVGTGATTCNDNNPCTDDTCTATSGCKHTANTASCDDGNKCTPTDKCSGGKCAGSGVTTCDDGNPCTTDACDAKAGCTTANNTATCNDSNACTTNDVCAAGKCGGGAINCQDGNPCTDNGCKVATGCTTNNNSRVCDDGNACTKTDKCTGGKCVGTGNPDCDDGNLCTIDFCKNATGCAHTNNTAGCDDGNKCTANDTCATGKCVGKAIACDDNNKCTTDTCDAKTGCVFKDSSASCNDSNACTTDSCSASAGCVNANNTASCDDGNKCTASDKCNAGKCTGSTVMCNDNNPCTDDACDPKSGCTTTNNTASCNDGDVCTGNDACSGGSCKGQASKACDDGNVCTSDSCDPKGGCTHTNNAVSCDDGNKCSANDKCSNGTCSGTGVTCNDNNACTDDSCKNTTGCVFTNNTATCNDGEDCTDGDGCKAGKCAGSAKVCNDSNACTTDACVKGKGCVFTVDTKSCDDGNVCTDDVCSPTSGCGHVNNTKICDVGNVCSGAGVCGGGNCISSKGIFAETVAGSSAGYADGTKSAARFNRPSGLGYAGNGAVLVADHRNHRIRRVSSLGVVTTIAGSGNAGLLNGNGLNAMFNRPYDVAVDKAGNAYVADYQNSVIRKIDPQGNVTTHAGTGVQGNTDGGTLSARFRLPLGLTTTPAGGVYVADTYNHRIRRIAQGNVATIAGTVAGHRDGPGNVARFRYPRGLDVDGQGVLYVADTNNHRIRRVEPNGQTSTIAGNGNTGFGDGAAATARFNYPWDVVMDSGGTLWIGDRNNVKVRKLKDSVVSTYAGSSYGYTDGNALSARFRYPVGLTVDETGIVFIADELNNRIRRVRNTQQACSVGNRCYAIDIPDPAKPCQVCDPGQNSDGFTALGNGDVCSDGSLCTTDDTCTNGSCAGKTENCDDQDKCTNDSCNTLIGGCLHNPIVGCDGNCKSNEDCDDSNECTVDLCVSGKCSNAPSGDPCDDGNECTIGDVCSNGKCATGNVVMVTTLAGQGPSGYLDGPATSARFSNPFDVVMNNDGATYVADYSNSRIRRIHPSGVVTTFAGSGNQGLADGTGTQAWFRFPSSLDVHRPSGDLYVADSGNYAIRRITVAGVVTTIAGTGTPGSKDANGTSASFNFPRGVAVTPGRTIYVGDYNNFRVRRIAPNGTVTTVAGSTKGFADGPVAVARFNRPVEVALDLAGNLFVVDRNNNRIRRISTTGIVTTVAGTGAAGSTDGSAATSTFRLPWGITVDSAGRVFIADRGNFRIRMLHKGFVFTIAGVTSNGFVDGPGPAARFSYPVGMGLTPNGVVLLADQLNQRVRTITLSNNACKIDNQCWSAELQNPGNACQVCDGAKNTTNWTARSNGAACLDGAYCSINDVCTSGKCGGTTLTCNDGDSCTKDFCDSSTGYCRFEPIPGCN